MNIPVNHELIMVYFVQDSFLIGLGNGHIFHLFLCFKANLPLIL